MSDLEVSERWSSSGFNVVSTNYAQIKQYSVGFSVICKQINAEISSVLMHVNLHL